MQIFDRYVLKEFIKFMLGSITLFAGVGMISKIVESLRFVRKYNGESTTIWLYYLYNIPFIVSIITPISFLLAITYITSKLIHNKELMIVRASGRSVKRTMVPVLLFSFLFSFFFLAFNEYIAYPSNLQAYAQKNAMRGRSTDFHAWRNRHEFNLRSGDRIFSIYLFNPNQKKIVGLHVVEMNQETGIRKIIRAEEASIIPNAWLLKEAEIITFKDSVFEKQKFYRQKEENIPEDFTSFQNTYYGIMEANIFQLIKLMNTLKSRGDDATHLEVEFYWHLSFPFICFFFVLIGVSVSFKTSGRGLGVSLSVSILCAVAYFIMMFYTKALGTSHLISPLWAGSLGNIIMGCPSVWVWFKFVE